MVYNMATAGNRISSWLADHVPLDRMTGLLSQTDGKWIGRSLLVPVAAGVLCAFVVDSVAVGGQGRAALTQMVKDPAAMFEGRSPGERGNGAMFQTKNKAVGTPSERTLSNIPVVPAQDVGLPVVGDAADPVATALFAQPEAPPADGIPSTDVPISPAGIFAPSQSFVPIFGGGTPADSGGNPGGGNPGGGNPGGGDSSTPPPPAVPEPATWASLILGLFTAGAVLRYQRRASVKALGTQPAR